MITIEKFVGGKEGVMQTEAVVRVDCPAAKHVVHCGRDPALLARRSALQILAELFQKRLSKLLLALLYEGSCVVKDRLELCRRT
jgi:hypothetical protein